MLLGLIQMRTSRFALRMLTIYTVIAGVLLFGLLRPSIANGLSDSASQEENVLVLSSWTAAGYLSEHFLHGFLHEWEMFRARGGVFFEYRDSRRFPGTANDAMFTQVMAAKYKEKKIAAIVVPEPGFTHVAATLRAQLGLSCPIISFETETGVPFVSRIENNHVILFSLQAKETLLLAKRFQPDLQKLFLIAPTNELDLPIRISIIEALKPFLGSTELVVLNTANIDFASALIEKLTPRDAILFVSAPHDEQGGSYAVKQWGSLLRERSKAPVYSLFKEFMPGMSSGQTKGTFVGGQMIDSHLAGQVAAKGTIEIVTGNLPLSKTTRADFSRLILDFNGMTRFGFDLSDLPKEAIVINQPVSFYETYKALVWHVGLGFVLLGVIIMLLVVNIRNREKAQAQLLTMVEKIKSNEERLIQNEKRFQAAVAASENSLYDIELSSGNYILLPSLGPRFFSETTRNVAEFVEHYVHPQDKEVREKAFAEYLAGKTDLYRVEYRIRDDQGGWRWVLSRGMAVRDAEGNAVRMIGSLTDITQLKETNVFLERIVEERTKDLKATLEDLEAFALVIAHDVKSPLRSIDGYGQFIEEDCAGKMEAEGLLYVKNIRRISQDLIALVDKLLEYSVTARGALDIEKIDMDALFGLVFEDLKQQEKARKVTLVIDSELPCVFGDRVLLGEVVAGSMSNAFKFTQPRTEATIQVRCEEKYGEYIFSVRDNGVGFDMQYVHKLFGIFQRLHETNQFAGFGVGLAMIRKIVGLHGGRTWMEGEVDAGATLFFTLPVKKHSESVEITYA